MTTTTAQACVLIIDDEEIIREALEALLLVEGFTVATAATGPQGIDVVERLVRRGAARSDAARSQWARSARGHPADR